MTEKIGLFTGTFDPLTNGHLDIIKRASQHFDQLYVGIFKMTRKIHFSNGQTSGNARRSTDKSVSKS